MSYKVTHLSPSDLDHKIKEQLSFWASPTLLDIIAKRERKNYYYITIEKNGNILATMPFFEARKYGIKYTYQIPDHLYTPIDFFLPQQKYLFDTQDEQLNITKAIAAYIKKHYLKVQLKIHPSISDMRGFSWNGFSVEPQYTYQKDLSDYQTDSLSKELKRQLRNAIDAGLYAKECWDLKLVEPLFKNTITKKDLLPFKLTTNYFTYLNDLYTHKLCKMLIIFRDNDPISAIVNLYDRKNATLYAILIGASENGYKLGANVFCFDYLFQHSDGIKYFDFAGANTPKIAFFKSQFCCQLIHYFRIQKKTLDIF